MRPRFFQEIAPGLRYHEQFAPWPHDDHALALYDIRHEPAKRSDLLAFDTETTGLAGGTGTRAFMIGAADFVDGALRIRQLCITTLGAERANPTEQAVRAALDVLVAQMSACIGWLTGHRGIAMDE